MTNKEICVINNGLLSNVSQRKKKRRIIKRKRTSLDRYLLQDSISQTDSSLHERAQKAIAATDRSPMEEPTATANFMAFGSPPNRKTSDNDTESQLRNTYKYPKDGALSIEQRPLDKNVNAIKAVFPMSPKSKLSISDSFKRLRYNSKRIWNHSHRKNKPKPTNGSNAIVDANSGKENVSETFPDVPHMHVKEYSPNKNKDTSITKLKRINRSDGSIDNKVEENGCHMFTTTPIPVKKPQTYNAMTETDASEKLSIVNTEDNSKNIECSYPNDINETQKVEHLINFDQIEPHLSRTDPWTDVEQVDVSNLHESLDINDQSEELDAEFNSLYRNSVSKKTSKKYPAKTPTTTSNCERTRRTSNYSGHDGSYRYQLSQDPLLATDKALDTRFNSLYIKAMKERDANVNNVQEYDSLLIDSSKDRSQIRDNIALHSLKGGQQMTSPDLIDFNRTESSSCSTRNDYQSDLSGTPSLDGSNKKIKDQQTKFNYSSSSCPTMMTKLDLSPIVSSTATPDHLNIFDPTLMPTMEDAYDDVYNSEKLDLPCISNVQEKQVFADNVDNAYPFNQNYSFPTDYYPSTQSSIRCAPKALLPERFSKFGSPVCRKKSHSQKYLDHVRTNSSGKQELSGMTTKLAHTMQTSRHNARLLRKFKSNQFSKRSKSAHNIMHQKNSMSLATISEDKVGIGPDSSSCEYLFKILVVGNLSTGKTSIIKQYVHNFFSEHYRATVGVDFALKVINWDENTTIRLQLWDIAGQERYAGGMTRVYYKEAVAALVVFDATDSPTLDAALRWKKDLDEKVTLPNGNPIPAVLLANKCDKVKGYYVRECSRMRGICRSAGFNSWFATSAKENVNIEEAITYLINKILMQQKTNFMNSESFDSDIISVRSQELKNKTIKNSCHC